MTEVGPEDEWYPSQRPDIDNPFGEWATDVALNALALRELLMAPMSAEARQEPWSQLDEAAFQEWFELEFHTQFLAPMKELSTQHIVDVVRYLETFRAALPFSNAEQAWLCRDYKYWNDLGSPDFKPRELLQRTEVCLVANGLHQVVQGRDLLRRWRSWRRQADEYEGEISLGIACQALNELAHGVDQREDRRPQHSLTKLVEMGASASATHLRSADA